MEGSKVGKDRRKEGIKIERKEGEKEGSQGRKPRKKAKEGSQGS